MSWQDNLRKGRFRDAEFLIDSAGGELGRRVALHEYPLRDLPYAEDLGRKARRFSMEMFVAGPKYMSARDKLIQALEKPGPGTLVHPYRGTLQVVVTQVSGPRESTREGGMASFSVTFVEAGENRQPSATTDTAARVSDKADLTLSVIKSVFGDKFSVGGFPEFVAEAAKTLGGKALSTISAVSKSIPALPTEAAAFAASLTKVSNNLASLIRQPGNLAADVVSLVSGLSRLTDAPEGALGMYRSMWFWGSDEPSVSATTPSRQAQANNQDAIIALVRQAAVIEAARAASKMDFDSYDQAVSVRDQISDRIDSEMETADDQAYAALSDLRVAMVADITARGADLARLMEYSLPVTLPALVVSYQLYGDATREAEIVSRNRIRQPGFVPAGRPLEVLTDA